MIVTVPLGVLKSKSIEFNPSLSSVKQTVIRLVWIASIVLAPWDRTFGTMFNTFLIHRMWGTNSNYFVNVNKFHPSSHALMTFAYAEYGRLTEKMTDQEVTSQIMTHLRDMYRSAVPDPTQMLRTKWSGNPNACSSYSYTAVPKMSYFEDMAEEVDETFLLEIYRIRLFLHSHGAYLSGIREAGQNYSTTLRWKTR